jgi:hypothetical protein
MAYPLVYPQKHAIRPQQTLPIRKTILIDTLADWTTSHCSTELDGDGIKVTHAGDGTSECYIYNNMSAAPIDVSNCHMGMDFTINAGSEGSAYTHIDTLRIQLKDVNNVTCAYIVATNANNGLYAGDVRLSIPPSVAYSGLPTVDFAQIKEIRLRMIIKSAYTYTPSVTYKKFIFYEKPKQPGLVLFGFDSTYASQFTCGEYLKSLGIPAFFNVCRTSVDSTDATRLSRSDLKKLKAMGHLITTYAWNLGIYWYNMTQVQKIQAISDNVKWLKTLGLSDGVKIVSVPGSGYAADDPQLYQKGYVDVITGRNDISNVERPHGFYGYHYPMACGPGVSNTYRTTAIDAAILDSSVCLFIFHQCTGQADDISYANFQTIANYAKTKMDAGLIKCVLPNQIPITTFS